MKQTALTVLTTLDPTRLDAKRAQLAELCRRLDAIRDDPPPASSDSVEEQLRALLAVAAEQRSAMSVHYLSFFVIDGAAPPRVVLEVNSDGSAAQLQRRLASTAPAVLREIFEGCDGFPGPAPERELLRFLRQHAQLPNAFYVAFPGRSVAQIRDEHALRGRAREALERETREREGSVQCPFVRRGAPEFRRSPTSASDIWRRLREQDAGEGALHDDPLVRRRERDPFRVRWSLGGDRWRRQLQLVARRLSLFAYVASVCAAGWLIYTGGLTRWAGRFDDVAAALALGAAALAGIWIALIWIGTLWQAPRALGWRGRGLVLRGALWESVAAGSWVAVLFSAAVLCVAAAAKLSTAALLISALSLVGVVFGLRRARLSWVGWSGTLLTLLAGGLLPAAALVLIPAALLALGWLAFMALFAVFLYVMLGRAAALTGPVLLSAGYAFLSCWLQGFPELAGARLLPAAGVFLALLAIVLVCAAAWVARWFWGIRTLEIEAAGEPHTHEPGRVEWDLARLERVQEREDLGLQNHLITVSPLRPGRLRLVTLERVLRAVQLAAWFQSNRGDLGGIRTIHFARFLVLRDAAVGPDGRAAAALMFIGNYDSGFGSYLHEFSEVSWVTAVWSSCVGFPQAHFLFGGGALDEQRFKAFGRNSQVPSLGWYSAYPQISIGDIEAARATRENLQRSLEDPSSWLARMRSRWGRTLSEADCDLSLRRV